MNTKIGNIEIKLGTGELHRFVEENNTTIYYLCPAKVKTNQILFQYILNDDNNVCDYVDGCIKALPQMALDYLETLLVTESNMLVRIVRYSSQTGAGFEVYYNYDGNDTVDGMIDWIPEHTNFAAQQYLFTEIKDGQQKPIQ